MYALAILAAIAQPGKLDYTGARAESAKTGKPLLVGIGCDPPVGPWIACRVSAPWDEWKLPCIVVGMPRGGEVYYHGTFASWATAKEIEQSLMPKAGNQRIQFIRRAAANC